MKKFILIIFTVAMLFGCREDAVEFTLEQSTADVVINSHPREAAIYLNNNFTGELTPDTLKNLEAGSYLLTLRLNGYKDSSETIMVEPERDQSIFITLKLL